MMKTTGRTLFTDLEAAAAATASDDINVSLI
jgi:hypothetical protein